MRIFKTRSISTEACKKGRVSVGGSTVKPSRTIKPGDVIDVRKPPVTYTFRVKALAENRLGARLVPEYLENITPKEQYDMLEMVRISGFVDRRKGLGRPSAKGAKWRRSGSSLARTSSSPSTMMTMTLKKMMNEKICGFRSLAWVCRPR